MYYNYHAKVKNLIISNKLLKYEFVENWNGIKPAMVFFFKDHKPMPIRMNKWELYFNLLEQINFKNPI